MNVFFFQATQIYLLMPKTMFNSKYDLASKWFLKLESYPKYETEKKTTFYI